MHAQQYIVNVTPLAPISLCRLLHSLPVVLGCAHWAHTGDCDPHKHCLDSPLSSPAVLPPYSRTNCCIPCTCSCAWAHRGWLGEECEYLTSGCLWTDDIANRIPCSHCDNVAFFALIVPTLWMPFAVRACMCTRWRACGLVQYPCPPGTIGNCWAGDTGLCRLTRHPAYFLARPGP